MIEFWYNRDRVISDITEKGTTMTTREIDRESFEKAKQLFISGENRSWYNKRFAGNPQGTF